MFWLRAVMLFLLPSLALAQSSPNFQTGNTLPAAQLNAAFASKADSTNGTLNTPNIMSPNITGNLTVSQPIGSNLHTVCDSGCSTSSVTATQTIGSNLHIVCDSGCSSSTAPADEAAFTFGTTSQTPVGGVFQTTATSNPLTTGQMGTFQVTANRALHTNLRTAAGVEIGVAAAPLQVSLANTAANGTAVAVSLGANQSTNVAQINAVTPLMGAGATGTGAQRVTAAQDTTTIAGAAPGTAGTASANVLSVQGIASMTPLQASQSGTWNVTNVSGTVSLPTGAATSANQSTEITSLSTIATNTGAATPAGGNTIGKIDLLGNAGAILDFAGQNASSPANAILTGCQFQTSPTTITAGNASPEQCDNAGNRLVNLKTALPAGTNAVGSVSQTNGDPCSSIAHAYTPINVSSAANTKIVTGTSAKKTYLCHLFLFAAAADNVGIVEGSGTNCATSPLGLIGGNTAATGINLAANQGFESGAGNNAIAASTVNANDVCLITSAGSQLSGVAVTVQN